MGLGHQHGRRFIVLGHYVKTLYTKSFLDQSCLIKINLFWPKMDSEKKEAFLHEIVLLNEYEIRNTIQKYTYEFTKEYKNTINRYIFF